MTFAYVAVHYFEIMIALTGVAFGISIVASIGECLRDAERAI